MRYSSAARMPRSSHPGDFIAFEGAENNLMSKCTGKSSIVMTIGHSTHPLVEFIALLKAHGVKQLVDVRTIPRSRHNPQFNRDTLATALRNVRIGYRNMKGLGGLRHAHKDSVNTGWRNAGFRGFADYMQTPEFELNLRKLIDLSRQKQIAIMCAEAVPWRCHRSLISDALTARGIPVEHIISGNRRQAHKLTSFAQVEGHRLVYPANATPDLPSLRDALQ
jgi:uncharacterized protein (DUF488 family)